MLTTAVLLWDSLEVIVPYPGFDPTPMIGETQQEDERAIRKAFELVVKPRSLTDNEKERLRTQLEELLKAGVPETLRFKVSIDNYNMYPEKLSPQIWDLLDSAGLRAKLHFHAKSEEDQIAKRP